MPHYGSHIHFHRVEIRCQSTNRHYDALTAAALLRKGIAGDDWTPEEITQRKQKARDMIKYAREIREEAEARRRFWAAMAECED